MFSRILVANRGEIAVRIARTCREMGIVPIAIYSAVDEGALHVRVAEEAYCVGPPDPRDSYLNLDTIVRVALDSGAEAVHPGYGFLAENDRFARIVQEAGLTWIGPPADVIALMGDKVRAKELAESVGVPILPGYSGNDQSVERMRAEAERIGFPVMIKAAAGGGGKGMRVVHALSDLVDALDSARREARGAFGDDRIFLEKVVPRARHIEVQIVADHHGNALYVGERDCTLQRRHQKVIEEAPSPALGATLRSTMGEAALKLARASEYVNAGTVEFLFSADQFHFLEMNTRIQVEHPVTEMISGLDLVRMQIEIAAGQPLAASQLDVELRGHAIEARLYAEDPSNGYLPSAGTLERFRPPEGPGVRNDVGVYKGAEVSPHYDPLLAKLIVVAQSREVAITRLQRALEDYEVAGVETNLGFLHWITEQPAFRHGNLETDFLDQAWVPGIPVLPAEALVAAAVFDATCGVNRPASSNGTRLESSSPWLRTDGWRANSTPRRFIYSYANQSHTVSALPQTKDAWSISVNGNARLVDVLPSSQPGVIALREGHEIMTFTIASSGWGLIVGREGSSYHLGRLGGPEGSQDAGVNRAEADVVAPMPGTVIKVAVREGQQVATRQPLVVLEAMKMEHVIVAPYDGVVSRILFREGDLVPSGSSVVHLDPI